MNYDEWVAEHLDILLDEAEQQGVNPLDSDAFDSFCNDKFESIYPVGDNYYE